MANGVYTLHLLPSCQGPYCRLVSVSLIFSTVSINQLLMFVYVFYTLSYEYDYAQIKQLFYECL